MVMEAMRLSLLEHEAQQRRQQEEEAKKQREAAAGGGGTTEEGSGEAPPAAPQPGPLPAPITVNESTGSNQLDADPSSAPRSRTSTSSNAPPSSGSGHLSPTSDQPSGEQSPGRGSSRSSPSPPYSISAAIFSAVSTATAVASPSEREPSDPLAEALPMSASTTDGNSGPQTPSPDATVNVPTISEVPQSLGNGQSITQPPPPQPPSFASSAYPSYDVLPSSPESSVSDKPLLDGSFPPTPAPEGEPSTATAS